MHPWLSYYFLHVNILREYLFWFLRRSNYAFLFFSWWLFFFLGSRFIIPKNVKGQTLLLLQYSINEIFVTFGCIQIVNDFGCIIISMSIIIIIFLNRSFG
jgi:hypothetical protein